MIDIITVHGENKCEWENWDRLIFGTLDKCE